MRGLYSVSRCRSGVDQAVYNQIKFDLNSNFYQPAYEFRLLSAMQLYTFRTHVMYMGAVFAGPTHKISPST